MSEDQKKQKEEAQKKALEHSYCVDATGQRKPMMEPYEDQINNE
jgi:hypothetical protein